ncbi:hypothetical protein BF49_1990 [Bradyrhizobium sp.]|jgi:hypothetical protein|nr:hypothetical protein BF49_1990 [Bradyrhizobium sp.]
MSCLHRTVVLLLEPGWARAEKFSARRPDEAAQIKIIVIS